MKRFFIASIRFYQRFLSLDTGYLRSVLATKERYCLMYPSCSEYMALAIEKYGPYRGIPRGLRRIMRCNPLQKEFVDIP